MAHQDEFVVETRGRGTQDITPEVARIVRATGVRCGLAHVFVLHTSASLLLTENADPDVRRDLDEFFRRLVPPSDDPGMQWLRHTTEGPDDMPAHVRAALTAVSLSVPVSGGHMTLGTWQGIYLWEHRTRGHVREIAVHVAGDRTERK